jgi:hypothetical protein
MVALQLPSTHCSPSPEQAGPLVADFAASLQQSNIPPQPSLSSPQVAPSFSQVVGTQVEEEPETPQWLAMPPPPQVSGKVHSPQVMTLPQPSLIGPHSPSLQLVLHSVFSTIFEPMFPVCVAPPDVTGPLLAPLPPPDAAELSPGSKPMLGVPEHAAMAKEHATQPANFSIRRQYTATSTMTEDTRALDATKLRPPNQDNLARVKRNIPQFHIHS